MGGRKKHMRWRRRIVVYRKGGGVGGAGGARQREPRGRRCVPCAPTERAEGRNGGGGKGRWRSIPLLLHTGVPGSRKKQEATTRQRWGGTSGVVRGERRGALVSARPPPVHHGATHCQQTVPLVRGRRHRSGPPWPTRKEEEGGSGRACGCREKGSRSAPSRALPRPWGRSRELCVAGKAERMASQGGRAGRETKKNLEEAAEDTAALCAAHAELAVWAAEQRADFARKVANGQGEHYLQSVGSVSLRTWTQLLGPPVSIPAYLCPVRDPTEEQLPRNYRHGIRGGRPAGGRV